VSENIAQKTTQPEFPEPIQPPTVGATTINAALEPKLDTPRAMLKRRKEVARAVKQFVRENKSMQLTIDGKKYPRAEVWQFCGACFGVTPMVTKTEELLTDSREEMGFLAIAHAINAAGRVISGAEATCMCSEADWAGKPSFQLRSMSETRACSKVLRNIFGDVMVMAGLCPTPAEEMGQPQREEREKSGTPCYQCGNAVSAKRAASMKKKYGKSLCLDCEKKRR